MGHFLPKMGPADFNLIPDHRGRDFSQPTCDQGSGGAVPSTSMDEPDPRTNTDPRVVDTSFVSLCAPKSELELY